MRSPAKNSDTSYRSHAVVPEFNRTITAESLGERNVRDTLLGRRDLVNLRDQWPRVAYIDGHGTLRHHVFDYCAKYANGFVEAVAVKPLSRVDRPDGRGSPSLREIIRLINVQLEIRRYAHHAIILTEADVSNEDARSAHRLRESRRYRDQADMAEAIAVLETLGSRFRLFHLLQGAADVWRREMAVWALIDDGMILAAEPGEIIDRSWLKIPTN